MAIKFPSFLSFVLDNPVRAFFTERKKLINRIGISEGMRVLEVGSGSGFFTPVLSETVGPKGTIIALDLQKRMIEKLIDKKNKKNLNNVETIVCNISECGLTPESIDFIFAYYCYHEFEDKPSAVRKFREVLKNKGYIFICEPRFEVKVKNKEEMKKLFIQEGFLFIEEWMTLLSYNLRFQSNL